MEYSKIDISLIQIVEKMVYNKQKKVKELASFINYGNEPLIIKTDWLDSWYNDEYKKLTIKVPQEIKLIMEQVDKLVLAKLPEGLKHSKLIKESNGNLYMNPKYTYCKVFDTQKKERPVTEICNNNTQMRCILGFTKIFNMRGYYGVKTNLSQCMAKPRELNQVPFAFDDE